MSKQEKYHHLNLLLLDVATFGWVEAAWFDEARKGIR